MIWHKIRNFFGRLSTRILVVIPWLLSLIPIAWALSLPGSYTGTPLQNNLINCVLFLWGLSGIPIIIRGETGGSIVVRGWAAYLQGILMVSIPWSIIAWKIITILRSK